MKRLTSIICVLCMCALQNVRLTSGCIPCLTGSVPTDVNASAEKSNNESVGTRKSPFIKSISIKVGVNIHQDNNDIPSEKTTTEDVVLLFSSPTSLNDLSPEEKQSAIICLTTSYRLSTDSLPPAVIVNLVTLFANSPQLFTGIPEPNLHTVFLILTANQCVLYGAEPHVLVQFLKGLLSLSPGALNSVPKSVLISLLRTISCTDILNALPFSAVKNLITVLSLSKSLIHCLPLPTLTSLLTFIDARSGAIMTGLSPSVLFGFFEGLLDTLKDSSPFLANTIPTHVLAPVFGLLMKSRILGVLPIDCFDSLLAVLGSSPTLSAALPPSNFISLINTLRGSPKILSSLNPTYVARFLITIRSCPSIANSIPFVTSNELLESITVYLPSSLECIPVNTSLHSSVVRRN